MSRAIVALLAGVLFASVAPPARAQRATAGVGYAFAEYAEQGSSLHFAGGGIAAHGSVSWRRWSLRASAAKLALEPKDDATGSESFDVLQADIALRVGVTQLISVEAGFLHRDVDPLHAAQSVGAMRLGAVIAVPLATGAGVEASASYVGASSFSGGGTAPFGVAIGLGVNYAPRWERVRLTGDLDFLRLDRRTESASGKVASPVQSTTARIGVSVVY